ncbi:hypothetical protein FHS85_001020 [Rhodoligotrophos appendicifer]|uniref:hypothetical protein n=1 Tax=Rhodoligotrophos appendicifer TaxID=987056 RepID=UPI00118169DE|nr:hypothetical protein [Rhodoligotrophos appendicifer]
MLSDAARLYNTISALHAALVDAGMKGEFELRLSPEDGAELEHMVMSSTGGPIYRGEVIEAHDVSSGRRAMTMSGIMVSWDAAAAADMERTA